MQELVATGRSLRGISRDLDLDYYTVRRYARAESLDALLAPAIHRRTLLDAHNPWLYKQFTLGQHNASHVYRQIRGQGYTGDRSTVWHRPRGRQDLPVATPHPPPPCFARLFGRLLSQEWTLHRLQAVPGEDAGLRGDADEAAAVDRADRPVHPDHPDRPGTTVPWS